MAWAVPDDDQTTGMRDPQNRIHVCRLTERRTGMTAFVRDVVASSIPAGSIKVRSSTSTNTGFAPQ
jgi:hypothetical protein